MQFDRLRLTGFKSFVDPTEVEIGVGLTGIVGPNGCGKSNLLEALRWVMGESSYKSMRASGMEDVIFAGSADRPTRNTAEVTLVLDNTARTAPASFNADDRIEVSRRIEREVGSVYRVNGKDVRARDVQLLFADASTGARSPALVRQGQIGELVSAKPQARRRILEEAAGIAGLHARRHEADLRLNAAETNLTRLDDVIGTLETQLNALKRQARQARRYRTLSQEIRAGESIQLYLRWREAADQVASEEQEFAGLKRTLEELTARTAETSRVQTEAAASLPELRDAEARAAAALHRLTLERDNLDAEARRAATRIGELEARLEQIEADAGRERHSLAETGQIIARLEEEEASLTSAGTGHADAVETAEAELTASRGRHQELEAKLDALSQEATRRATERVALEKAIAARRERLQRIDSDLAEIDREVSSFQTESDGAETVAAQTANVAALADRLATAETEADAAEQALANARQSESAARGRCEQAEREAERLDTEIATLRKVLSVSDSDLWPPLIDAVGVEPGYETALGAALGDDLDASADTAAPVHWRTLGDLADADPLPGDALPLSKFVTAPPALSRRLGRIGVVDPSAGADLQADLKPGQRLVARDGTLWRWDGYTAAADAPAAAHRLAERNRLRGLEDDASGAREKAASAGQEHQKAVADLSAAETAAETARDVWRDISKALGEARDALATSERESSETMSRIGALNEARHRLEQERDSSREDLAAEEAQLAATARPEALEGDLAGQRERVAAARLEENEALAKVRALEARAEQRQQRLADIARERDSWRERGQRAQTHLQTLEERTGGISEEITALSALPDQTEDRRAKLVEAILSAEDARKTGADMLAAAETRLKEADGEAKAAQDSLNEARTEVARIETRLEGARQRMSEFGRDLGEALDCAPDIAAERLGLQDGDEMPAPEDIERRLAKHRAERERLGGVNLRAEEEAAELNERLETLVSERNDLINAITKLRQGIAKLNGEGRKRLVEAFDTVNANFETLFTKLFGGGKARLELIDSDDPLEAGLEIKAMPPGKRLQVISLLSGGEKALTAIALIFAVFLTNPSPVCVLDEVDAPLDDTNVERICALLEEMERTTDTRFIIITHHPYTMSRMRRLYGVTMAERGVSQIVSVDLQEAERLREAG